MLNNRKHKTSASTKLHNLWSWENLALGSQLLFRKCFGYYWDWILPLFYYQWTSFMLVEWGRGDEIYNEGLPHRALRLWHNMKKWFLLTGVAHLNVKPNMWLMSLRSWHILKKKHWYQNLILLIVFLSFFSFLFHVPV